MRNYLLFFFFVLTGPSFAQTLTTQAPTSITSTSAIFHGAVTPANQLTTVRFLWGKTAGVYSDSAEANESPIAGTTAQNVSYSVSSLKVNTTSYVILSAKSSAAYVRSNEISFTTTALAPKISAVGITTKTDTAFVTFAVTANNAATTITVAYGLTSSYGSTAIVTPSTTNGDTLTSVTAVLGTLTPSTSYHFQISAQNNTGVVITTDSTFLTKAFPPTISSFSPTSGKAGAQVTINGSNFDVSTNVSFLGDGSLIRTLTGHTSGVLSVAYSPDGQTVASGSYDQTIKLWRASDGGLIRTLTGHTNAVFSVAYSPDGQTLASGGEDQTIKLWRVSDGSLIRTLTGHSLPVFSVAYSPDGQTLASASGDQTIKLWRVSNGSLIRTLTAQTNYIRSVAYSPDGQTIASGGDDQTIRFWRVNDGGLIRTLTGHSTGVVSVAYSPDGQTVASGSRDPSIKLWRVSDGSLIRTLTGHSFTVSSVAYSPDGKTIASGSDDKTIKLWRVSDGGLIRTLTGHSSGVYSVAYSPDGYTVTSGSGDQTVELWLVASKSVISNLSSSSLTATVPPNSVTGKITVVNSGGTSFSANDFTFYQPPVITSFSPAIGTIGTTVTIFGKNFTGTTAVTFGTIAAPSFAVVSDTIITAAASNGGEIGISAQGGDSTSSDEFTVPPTASTGDTLYVGNTKVKVHFTLNPFSTSSTFCYLTVGKSSNNYTDTLFVKSFGYYGKVDTTITTSLYNLQPITTYYYRAFAKNGAGSARGVEKSFTTSNYLPPTISSISPSLVHHGDTLLITGNNFYAIDNISSDITTTPRTFAGHSLPVFSVAYSPDGQTLASASDDQTIKLWHVNDGLLIRTLIAHSLTVFSVAYSPDGKTLASGSRDQTIKLWRVNDGTLIRNLTDPSAVYTVAYSPDGQTVTSGSADQTIKLWRVNDGTLIRTLTGHTDAVLSVAYGPDGQTVASGSADQTIKLWRVNDGTLIRTLTGHTNSVQSVAYSPDGQMIASGSADGTIKLWRKSDGTLIRNLTDPSAVYTVAYSPDGQTVASSGSNDKIIKLWRVSDGTLLRTLTAHSLPVYSVAYSPDGQTLASGSGDKSIKLWSIRTGLSYGLLSSLQVKIYLPQDSLKSFTINAGGGEVTGVFTITNLQQRNEEHIIPLTYSIDQNFPNPFNPSTTLRYGLPMSSRVKLQIYTVLGQTVCELVNAEQPAGWYESIWNTKVSSGLYFYRIEAVSITDPNNRFVQVKKMLLLK